MKKSLQASEHEDDNRIYTELSPTLKRKKKVEDLRSAAFINALNKISSDYLSLGIFP